MSDFKSAPLSFSITAETKNINTNITFYTQDYGSARLEFAVFKDTKPMDLTDATANITFVMADNSVFEVVATIDDALNGMVSYTLPQEIIEHSGKALAELIVYFEEGGRGLSVGQFSFTINQSLTDQNIQPAQELLLVTRNLEGNIKGTSQTVTTDSNGDVIKIQHVDSNNVVIREDTFDYTTPNVVVETRTLISTGTTLTFRYNTDTLSTEVI